MSPRTLNPRVIEAGGCGRLGRALADVEGTRWPDVRTPGMIKNLRQAPRAGCTYTRWSWSLPFPLRPA